MQSGSVCTKCGKGRLRTISSRHAGERMQLRYLACSNCSNRCKSLVPAASVFRRSIVEPHQSAK